MKEKLELIAVKNNVYKANLHCHSTYSDGKFTVEELKKMFIEQGYQIVAFTDHVICHDHSELTDENFLALTAYELEIPQDDLPLQSEYRKCYHMNLFAKEPHNTMHVYFDPKLAWGNTAKYAGSVVNDPTTPNERPYNLETVQGVIDAANRNGFLVTYNHPSWSLQNFEDYKTLNGIWGVEVSNTACRNMGFENDSHPHIFQDIIRSGKKVFPIAADDCHHQWHMFSGFVKIFADKLTYSEIINSLENGNFYASTGPEIESVSIKNNIINIKCSPCRQIRVLTERRCAFSNISRDGNPFTDVSFDLSHWFFGALSEKKDDAYIRIHITDENGYSAYTRAYFYDEVKNAFVEPEK